MKLRVIKMIHDYFHEDIGFVQGGRFIKKLIKRRLAKARRQEKSKDIKDSIDSN